MSSVVEETENHPLPLVSANSREFDGGGRETQIGTRAVEASVTGTPVPVRTCSALGRRVEPTERTAGEEKW